MSSVKWEKELCDIANKSLEFLKVLLDVLKEKAESIMGDLLPKARERAEKYSVKAVTREDKAIATFTPIISGVYDLFWIPDLIEFKIYREGEEITPKNTRMLLTFIQTYFGNYCSLDEINMDQLYKELDETFSVYAKYKIRESENGGGELVIMPQGLAIHIMASREGGMSYPTDIDADCILILKLNKDKLNSLSISAYEYGGEPAMFKAVENEPIDFDPNTKEAIIRYLAQKLLEFFTADVIHQDLPIIVERILKDIYYRQEYSV